MMYDHYRPLDVLCFENRNSFWGLDNVQFQSHILFVRVNYSLSLRNNTIINNNKGSVKKLHWVNIKCFLYWCRSLGLVKQCINFSSCFCWWFQWRWWVSNKICKVAKEDWRGLQLQIQLPRTCYRKTKTKTKMKMKMKTKGGEKQYRETTVGGELILKTKVFEVLQIWKHEM